MAASSAYLVNDLLDTKLKVLAGYTGGTSQIDLAIQRGEVHGRASAEWERIKLLKEWTDMVVPVLQMSTRRAIDLHEGDRLNERAFKALITAAVKRNTADRR